MEHELLFQGSRDADFGVISKPAINEARTMDVNKIDNKVIGEQ